MTVLVEVRIAESAAAWACFGLAVADDTTVVGTVRLRFGADADAMGITVFDGGGLPSSIDGVAAFEVPDDGDAPVAPSHPLGARHIDHVVVGTPDLARTVAAFEAALRTPVKRIRTETTGSGDRLHQAFFRLGQVILEIVGPPEPDAARAAEPAAFRGMVFTVDDVDAAYELMGSDVLTTPKAAVQSGKRITTVRREVGLGWPVALLSGSR